MGSFELPYDLPVPVVRAHVPQPEPSDPDDGDDKDDQLELFVIT